MNALLGEIFTFGGIAIPVTWSIPPETPKF